MTGAIERKTEYADNIASMYTKLLPWEGGRDERTDARAGRQTYQLTASLRLKRKQKVKKKEKKRKERKRRGKEKRGRFAISIKSNHSDVMASRITRRDGGGARRIKFNNIHNPHLPRPFFSLALSLA